MVLLVMIVWAIAELFVIVKVADAVGVLATVLLLLAGWPVGAWLVRAEGRAAWRRLSAAITAGRPPGREAIEGALVLIGGTLLIVPGFISDAIGLSLLFAPTRALARRGIAHNLHNRLVVSATRFTRRPSSSYDVDSTATDSEPPPLPR